MNPIPRTVLLAIPLIAVPFVRAGEPADDKCIQVYTTAKDANLRMTLSDHLQLKPAQQSPENDIAIFVNPDRRYQTMLGIGGAITKTSGSFALSPGRHKLLFRSIGNEWNINWFEIKSRKSVREVRGDFSLVI